METGSLKQKWGCLHAHYSNVEMIQNALASQERELVHYVDPGLISRLQSDRDFGEEQAKKHVMSQLEWIARTGVDAILVTCTQYIALLDENSLQLSIPVHKIDEPFFRTICAEDKPQLVLFSNPATVEGTMHRLHAFAASIGRPSSHIEPRVLENIFELLMRGEKKQYAEAIQASIQGLVVQEEGKALAVGQLSMSEAAELAERELHIHIVNPLKALRARFIEAGDKG